MKQIFQCRSCKCNQGKLILDLGVQPLANSLLHFDDLQKPEKRFPLRVFVCPDCWLLQITDLVPPEALFSEYIYFSSFSEAMLQHARNAAERYHNEFRLGRESLVLEIASNDGYLLQNFLRFGVPSLGIEPAVNVAAVARRNGIETISEFFGGNLAQQLVKNGRQADLVLGNNVFAHAPDINDFVSSLGKVTKFDGRIVLEFPYAVDLIERTEFDTIYHEHVFYFSLTALIPLFQRHRLSIFSVEKLPIHGGSLRLFVGHDGRFQIEQSVDELLAEEKRKGINTLEYYEGFSKETGEVRENLLALLKQLKNEGTVIVAYGASAKGSTLLNFCGIREELITFVVDRSHYKQGKFTPGSHLPIVNVDRLVELQPDYTLLLAWNFADEILRQQETYRSKGGKFIIPIPKMRVV